MCVHFANHVRFDFTCLDFGLEILFKKKVRHLHYIFYNDLLSHVSFVCIMQTLLGNTNQRKQMDKIKIGLRISSKNTTSFQRSNNVADVQTTLLQRQNDVVGHRDCKNYRFRKQKFRREIREILIEKKERMFS